jgi:hypothetical protein
MFVRNSTSTRGKMVRCGLVIAKCDVMVHDAIQAFEVHNVTLSSKGRREIQVHEEEKGQDNNWQIFVLNR